MKLLIDNVKSIDVNYKYVQRVFQKYILYVSFTRKTNIKHISRYFCTVAALLYCFSLDKCAMIRERNLWNSRSFSHSMDF